MSIVKKMQKVYYNKMVEVCLKKLKKANDAKSMLKWADRMHKNDIRLLLLE